MNTNIIKLLLTLKNASASRKELVLVPFNRLSIEFLKILYKEGFIQSFYIQKSSSFLLDKNYQIKVVLRFFYNKPIISNLKIISTPSFNKYLKFKDLCKLSDKKNVLFFSTSKGLLTSFDCKKQRVGGTLLFIC